MILSSERLHTFAVFAEDQNLSRAAKRLHLSQPAVHAQLKALAADLRVALYQRVGRGLVLTKEGIEVAAFARELEERADDLVQRLHDDEVGDSSRLVLAAGAGALVHLLARGLRTFHRSQAARPRVEVVTADALNAVDLVRRGLAHVGVGVLQGPPPPALDCHVLAKAAQVVVVPRAHRLSRKRTAVTLADLADEELVAPPEGGPQRSALNTAFAMKGLTLRTSAVARGWDVVLKLVELDVGVGIVNDTCAIPSSLVARPLRELPAVTYLAFTRPHPRQATTHLLQALLEGARR